MISTSDQFENIINQCREIFLIKMKDYGSSWRVLRTPSLTDQIYIKAQRIRSIADKGTQKISEGIKPEFIGMVNYSVMALIQLELHAFIRKLVTEKYGKAVADDLSILYGGSCNSKNAKELFANPDVDGGLIGGASLKSDEFIKIVKSF